MSEDNKKICPKCKGIYNESVGDTCPNCNEPLEAYKKKVPIDISYEFIKNKFLALPPTFKKIIAIIMTVVIFVLGIMIGSSSTKSSMVSKEDYQKLEENNSSLRKESDLIRKSYDDYKAKMQPYESQREADIKAAEEKAAAEKAAKEAEEKAKKEAEEKARQEAEAKAKAEQDAKNAEARANSLGLTVSEFIDKYNIQAAQYNADTAIKPSDMSSSFVNTTINRYTDLQFATSNGFATMVYVNLKNSGSEAEATMYQIECVCAAQAVDSSISYQTAIGIISDLAVSSINDLGNDVSQTYNGYKYTMNSVMGSTMFVIMKAR